MPYEQEVSNRIMYELGDSLLSGKIKYSPQSQIISFIMSSRNLYKSTLEFIDVLNCHLRVLWYFNHSIFLILHILQLRIDRLGVL